MTEFLYDEVEDCWYVVNPIPFSTLEKAKQYLNDTSPNCKGEKYCMCDCGLHKENGDH